MNKLLILSILHKSFQHLLDKIVIMHYNEVTKRKEDQFNENGNSAGSVNQIKKKDVSPMK